MSGDGEMYTFSDHIPVEVNNGKVVNPFGVDEVQGCIPHKREPSLAVLWVAPAPMLQVAPGHKWCSCCADVRPLSYFDVVERDADGNPTKHNHECRMCVNARDPKLAKEKYCSACKVMHPMADFADDPDYADGKYPSCYKSEARRKAAGRARKAWLDEGRTLRQWRRVAAG